MIIATGRLTGKIPIKVDVYKIRNVYGNIRYTCTAQNDSVAFITEKVKLDSEYKHLCEI